MVNSTGTLPASPALSGGRAPLSKDRFLLPCETVSITRPLHGTTKSRKDLTRKPSFFKKKRHPKQRNAPEPTTGTPVFKSVLPLFFETPPPMKKRDSQDEKSP
jgi:hypothetical protein